MRKLIGLFLVAASASVASAEDGSLSGSKLREAIAGRTVYVQSPLGEFPIRYAPNGTMSARTELALVSGESKSADQGRWWIADNRLCVQWRTWLEGKPSCYTMQRSGRSMVRWQSDDGKSGTARLG